MLRRSVASLVAVGIVAGSAGSTRSAAATDPFSLARVALTLHEAGNPALTEFRQAATSLREWIDSSLPEGLGGTQAASADRYLRSMLLLSFLWQFASDYEKARDPLRSLIDQGVMDPAKGVDQVLRAEVQSRHDRLVNYLRLQEQLNDLESQLKFNLLMSDEEFEPRQVHASESRPLPDCSSVKFLGAAIPCVEPEVTPQMSLDERIAVALADSGQIAREWLQRGHARQNMETELASRAPARLAELIATLELSAPEGHSSAFPAPPRN